MKQPKIPLELVGAINWSPEYGNIIKEMRLHKQMSRIALRDKIKGMGFNISPQNVQKIEDGGLKTSAGLQAIKTVPIETLEAILVALDCPLNKFFNLIEKTLKSA